jgi:hypothetical protein
VDCAGACGGSAVYQLYYLDSDGDGDGSEAMGWMCSADAALNTPNPYVANQNDEDDNCFTNTHDECGVCDGPNTNSCVDESLTNTCDLTPDEDGDGIWIDCTGTCNGLTQYTELFEDSDGDHLGGDTQGYYCMTPSTIVTASTNSWISTGGDFDDDCDCSANDPDVGGSCLDECEICNGPNYIASCSDGSCVTDTDADGKAMDCAGNCCEGDCDENDAISFFR